jgi:hypothetical protein
MRFSSGCVMRWISRLRLPVGQMNLGSTRVINSLKDKIPSDKQASLD